MSNIYELEKNYPYRVDLQNQQDWEQCYDWCLANMGSRSWTFTGFGFHFKHTQDAMAFSLKWL